MSSASWKTILVAVGDPGARKQVAIAKAARIAARSGASITLFHAFSMPLPPATATDAGTLLRRVAKERLDQLHKRARALRAIGLDVECEVVWDFPAAHAIVRRVLESEPDLVVAQSHRHSKLARWFLTNSDWDLIRECPCPVWFVKHERLPKKPLILTAVDPTHAHAKPSGLDDRLLQAATNVMRQLGGHIAVIHVEDTAAGARKSNQAQSAATVEALDGLMERHGVVADRIVRAGKPAEVLAASAAQMNADLLVMGAVSRSGLSLSHIGHTAEAVIDAVADRRARRQAAAVQNRGVPRTSEAPHRTEVGASDRYGIRSPSGVRHRNDNRDRVLHDHCCADGALRKIGAAVRLQGLCRSVSKLQCDGARLRIDRDDLRADFHRFAFECRAVAVIGCCDERRRNRIASGAAVTPDR